MKKIISFFLSFIMSVLLLPVNVYAENTLNTNIIFNTDKPGNIYFTGETAEFEIQIFNNSENTVDLSFDFTANGRKYNVCWNEEKTISLDGYGEETLNLSINLGQEIGKYDIYDAVITLSDGVSSNTFEKEFSYVRKAKKNSKFGVNTHYANIYYQNTIDKTIPLLNGAGISIVRDGEEWAAYEKTKGKYAFSESFAQVPDKLYNGGIELLYTLLYGNALYTESNSHFPETTEEIQAFTNYAVSVAEKLKGKHRYFELWNEPNIKGNFNATGSGGNVYANLAKSVYPALEFANPDAYMVGVAYSGNPSKLLASGEYIEDALENGAADYMDAISWHPYAEWGTLLGSGNQPPESYMDSWFDTFNNLINGYDIGELWTTEQGWSAKYGNSDMQVATYLPRQYAIEIEEGVDKYFWYELINERVATSGDEAEGWGMLRNIDYSTPLAAKPVFLSAAAMNDKLANTKFVNKTENDSFIRYNFEKIDTSTLAMIWSTSGEKTQDIDFGENAILKTDIYGNEEVLYSDTGIYSITATAEPAYYEMLLDDEVSFKYDYDFNTGVCTVYGQINSKTKDVPVNIILYRPSMSYLNLEEDDATGAAAYFDQIKTGIEGYFDYKFEPNGPEGYYTFVMSSADGDLREYSLKLKSELFAEVSPKNKEITDIKEGDSFVCSVNVTGTNTVTKVFDVFVALYDGDKLVAAYSKNDEIMRESNSKTTEIPVENAPYFNKMKAFVWEKDLRPVTNSPELVK